MRFSPLAYWFQRFTYQSAAKETDFAALERTLALQREHERDWDRLLQLDTRFHLDVARATHNPTLVGLVKPLLRKLEGARDMALRGPEVAAWTIDIHRRTIDALATCSTSCRPRVPTCA